MSDPVKIMQAKVNEPCPNCGNAVHVHYGPDIRFTPPCSKPLMYRAECSGDCSGPSWTSFTKERALSRWNEGAREIRAARATEGSV